LGCVPEDARAVENEPGDGQPEEDGDIDGLAEAATSALVFDGIEEADEFVLVEFAVAVGAKACDRLQGLLLAAVGDE